MEMYLHAAKDDRLKAMAEYEGPQDGDPFDVSLIRKVFLEEVFVTNVIGCKPNTTGSNLSDDWVFACRPRLEEIIYQVDPLVVMVLGRHALRAVIGKTKGIEKNMGRLWFSTVAGRKTILRYPVVPLVQPGMFVHKRNPGDWEPGGKVDAAKRAVGKAFWLMDRLRQAYHGTPAPERGPRK